METLGGQIQMAVPILKIYHRISCKKNSTCAPASFLFYQLKTYAGNEMMQHLTLAQHMLSVCCMSVHMGFKFKAERAKQGSTNRDTAGNTV